MDGGETYPKAVYLSWLLVFPFSVPSLSARIDSFLSLTRWEWNEREEERKGEEKSGQDFAEFSTDRSQLASMSGFVQKWNLYGLLAKV